MTRHYPDLGSASDWLKHAGTSFQPIRSTTKIWVVMRHQYGISALVTQTSFCEGSSGELAKCRLFSQANNLSEMYSSGLLMNASIMIWRRI